MEKQQPLETHVAGIFITKIRPDTPAAASPHMREGMQVCPSFIERYSSVPGLSRLLPWQILMVNNVDVEEATLIECRALLRDTTSLSLLLQENPLGFAAYQARAGVSR